MRYVFAFACIFFLQWAHAQHPAYYHINDENGLPSNEVYRLVQDDFGYIWIGCDAGLFRYDGFKFKKYSHPKQNGASISFLQIDNQQRIWCKNFFGQIYRVDGDSLKIIKGFHTTNPSYPQFVLGTDNRLWTYSQNKLLIYNDRGDSLKTYTTPHSENIISLKFFRNDLYIFYRDLSVIKFDAKQEKYTSVPNSHTTTLTYENCMAVDHQNNLYLLAESNNQKNKYSLYKTDGHSMDVFHEFILPENGERVYSIFSDKKNLWATTSFGTFRLDVKNQVLFEKEKISHILLDREGQYWFSSLQNGLFVIPEMEIIRYDSKNSGLSDNHVMQVKSMDDNHLLIGSYPGNVFEMDCFSRQIVEKFKNKQERFISVKFIEQNKKHTIVSRGRLCVIDNVTGKQFFPNTSNIRDAIILGDTIYLVQPEFIVKSSLRQMTQTTSIDYIKVLDFGAKSIEYDEKNNLIYILSSNGLYYSTPNGKWIELLDKKDKISGNTLCYNNEILWVATISNGVYGIENKQIKYNYNTSNQLKENNVRTIKTDGSDLWICTENYLHRINLITNKVAIFGSAQSIHTRDIHSIELDGKNVYLATNKGLVSFPKQLDCTNEIIPNIAISNVMIDDSILHITEKLELPYDNNRLKIEVSSISLKSRNDFYYQYRLLGLDSNWTSFHASTPYVAFSRIPSGNFIFQVKSVNQYGIESEIKSLAIYVETPFWQQWWFYMLIVLLTVGIAGVFFMARINAVRRRAELKNKIVASQLTALKSQMNPHFMFNALNSIQDLVLQQDIKNSNLYISKFSSLMRKVLDASGEDIISLQDEIEILELYLDLEKLRFGDEFKFEIVIKDHFNTNHVFIPPMILQPFVENAIKHGLMHKKNDKKLAVTFELDTSLICTITDNGVGRKRSSEINQRQTGKHQSFATQATEKRIELLNSYAKQPYSFEIIDLEQNGIATGTKIIITIPIHVS